MWFSWASRVPFLDVIVHQGIRGATGPNFSECRLFPGENGGPTCQGTARTSFLMKRIFFSTVMKRREIKLR